MMRPFSASTCLRELDRVLERTYLSRAREEVVPPLVSLRRQAPLVEALTVRRSFWRVGRSAFLNLQGARPEPRSDMLAAFTGLLQNSEFGLSIARVRIGVRPRDSSISMAGVFSRERPRSAEISPWLDSSTKCSRTGACRRCLLGGSPRQRVERDPTRRKIRRQARRRLGRQARLTSFGGRNVDRVDRESRVQAGVKRCACIRSPSSQMTP